MARRKRTSPIEDLLELCYEIIGYFWQVGAVITAIFFFLGLHFLDYALIYQIPENTYLTALFSQLSWLPYLMPAALFFLSFLFGIKSYNTYQKQNSY